MNIFINDTWKSAIYHKKAIILFLLCFTTLIVSLFAGRAIAHEKWHYLGLIFSPIFVYLSIERPFIFPFGLYVFLLPFDNLLSVTGNDSGAGTTVTKLLGVLTMVVLLLKGIQVNKFLLPDKAILCWLLLIAYSTTSAFWAIETESVISQLPTSVGLFLLYIVAVSYRINKTEYETIKWCSLTGGSLAALIIIYFYYTGFFFSAQRVSLMMGSRLENPNTLAFCLFIPVAICIQKIVDIKGFLLKLSLMVNLFVLLTSIAVTGSRAGAYGLIVIFAVYFLFSKRKFISGMLLITVGVIFFYAASEFFFDRYTTMSVDHSGATRLHIWHSGLLAFKEHWILGAGLNNFMEVYSTYAFSGRDSHNIFIASLVEFGSIGTSFLILGMVMHYPALRLRYSGLKDDGVMLTAVFWAALLFGFFHNILWQKPFWLLWILILMLRNLPKCDLVK